MALICLRCASAACTCGLLATAMGRAPQSRGIDESGETLANPVMLSSGQIIAAADDPIAELETLFVLRPRDD
jgi:hypothetical protein